MDKKIKLFNYYHNGDIFYSRMLVQLLLRNNYHIEYYHNLNTPLLEDYENLTEIKGIPSEWPHNLDLKDSINNGVLNTWVAQGDARYFNSHLFHAACFENHYLIVKDVNNILNLDLKDDELILPNINFTGLKNYESLKIKMEEYKENYKKIILFCNGNVHSGQAVNFDFTGIINQLSTEFPNYLFITTQNITTNQTNVVNSLTLTETLPDLNHIGFISTYCDVIVGRNSGPYCYTMVESNMMDDNKTYICFSGNENEAKFYQNAKFKFFWSNNYEINHVSQFIKNKI